MIIILFHTVLLQSSQKKRRSSRDHLPKENYQNEISKQSSAQSIECVPLQQVGNRTNHTPECD
jgi:hypothetical protein